MSPKKRIWFFLFLVVTLLIPIAVDQYPRAASTTIRADGPEPPPPPIPYYSGMGDRSFLTADGPEPPPPPIPYAERLFRAAA